MTPIAAAVPDVLSLLEQIVPLGTWYAAVDLAMPSRYLFIGVSRSNLAEATLYLYISQWYINSPALCHSLLRRNLGYLSLTQNIILLYYIDDIILIGPSKQEIATTLDLLVTIYASEDGK